MPQWSVAEWRARIGGSWFAIGRPFKTESSFSRGAGWVRRVLTMNQVVTMTIMMTILIGINLILCALVNRGYHRPIIDQLRFGLLSHWNLYLLNSGYLFILAVTSSSSSLYQCFPSVIKKSLRQFSYDLKQGLCLISQLLHVSIMETLICPVLWLVNFVLDELNWISALSVLIITLASDQVAISEGNCSVVKDKVELNKRGELLRRLTLARALLDIILSVAIHVIIISLLLMSGDIEENPGPGELDYDSVDASQILDEDDLTNVIEEVISIKSLYYPLGRSLGLKLSNLRAIRDVCCSESDSEQALEDVLLLWLNQKYNVERFGPPTWQMLVKAVDKKTGGSDHELATEIASKHLTAAEVMKSPAPSTTTTPTKDRDIQSHDNGPSLKVIVKEKSESSHGSQSKQEMETNKEEVEVMEGDQSKQEVKTKKEGAEITEEHLNIDDMREVLDILWNYRAKWNLLGIQLGIKACDLDAIDVDNRRAEDALVEIIKLWLYQANPKPTRSALTKALGSRYVQGEVTSTSGFAQEDNYSQYLKALYKAKTLASSSDDEWPPPCTDKVVRLAMIKSDVRRGDVIDDAVVREKTISGKVDDVLQRMVLIEVEDIFKFKVQQKKVKKVLMEGAPGSGKSTLSFDVCRQWTEGHLFQEYKLVILVRLRELAIQNAKRLAKLLPRCNDKMGHVTEAAITASNGENVLFILDGWDELPRHVPAYLLILDLVKGTKLPASSVIVTSRPTSSAILHSLVDLQIEILGFNKNELQRYFSKCLENSDEATQRLLQRIKQNPIVEGTCYLPLNASILVHLFKCGGNVLPTTQYGIFTELVLTCIFRHLKKTHQDINGLDSLDELPPPTAAQFKHLCKVAYDGVMQDVVIFNLGPNFNTLGLLQGVESLAICGKSYSYNFLHLSIQELLCAIHMASELDEMEQTEQFKKLFGKPRFMLVFQFFAAKTKLRTSGISEIVTQVAKQCSVGYNISREDRTLLVSLVHCLFEAQDSSLCQLVASELKQNLILGTYYSDGINLDPADCYYLGYFLTFCKGFNVDLSRCSIGDDHCKSLFREEAVYDLCSLHLEGNPFGNEGAMALAAAMKTATNLQQLNLTNITIGREGETAIRAAARETNTEICFDGLRVVIVDNECNLEESDEEESSLEESTESEEEESSLEESTESEEEQSNPRRKLCCCVC